MQDLLERRLVALALVLAAHQHGGGAAGREADLRELRLGAGGALDGVHHGQPAQLAPPVRRVPPQREAGDVGQLERGLHVGAELPAVVRHAERRLVRHRGGRNDVAPPQLDGIGGQLAGGVVDEPLHDVRRLRPPGAAIGRRRVRVAEHTQHLHVGGGERVDAHQRDDVAERGEQVAVGGDVRAHVGQRLHAQGQEVAVRVQRQLGVGDVVARVLVGRNGLAALARPFHRAAELARRPQHQPVLGVLPALGAEGAADVAHDHADRVLGHLEDVGGQRVAHAVRILHVGVERVAALAGIPGAQRAARLQVLRVHARDHVAPAHHPRGAREGRVGRGLVAGLVQVGDVVRAGVPHRGPAAGRGGRGGHRGQRSVIDLDPCGGVLGLGERLGHDHGDRIAHVAHALAGQRLVRRREHRRAVRALALERHRHGAERIAQVGAREDRQHAGQLRGGLRVDAREARVGVDRAHDHGVRLPGEIDIVVEAALAPHEAHVLEALDPLPDPELSHLFYWGPRHGPQPPPTFGTPRRSRGAPLERFTVVGRSCRRRRARGRPGGRRRPGPAGIRGRPPASACRWRARR